jgi:hypothetical protein
MTSLGQIELLSVGLRTNNNRLDCVGCRLIICDAWWIVNLLPSKFWAGAELNLPFLIA